MKTKLVALGLITIAPCSTSTHAQVTIDATKITCEQFVFSKIAPVRSVALWMSRYYSGKRSNSIIDLQAFEANAEKVELFCKQQKNLKLPLLQAVEQALGNK